GATGDAEPEIPVETVRTAIVDSGTRRGLTDDVVDLITGAWAAQTRRSWFLHSSPVDEPDIGDFRRRGLTLRVEPLPDRQAWVDANARWTKLTGQRLNDFLTPSNVAGFAEAVREYAKDGQGERVRLTGALRKAYEHRGIDTGGRLSTATALDRLLAPELSTLDNLGIVGRIAEAELGGATESEASRSLATSPAVADAIEGLDFSGLNILVRSAQGGESGDSAVQAANILHELDNALTAQEFVTPLATALTHVKQRREAWLEHIASHVSPPGDPTRTPGQPGPDQHSARSGELQMSVSSRTGFSLVEQKLAELLAEHPDATFTVTITEVL
ncbi:MAG: phage resistance protein, partial [Dietzia sp.]|nr:phage resistance protein [Dietzia sp.]